MNVLEVNKHLEELGLTLGSAESFTGGLFASTITSVGGASKVFKGSFVTYATEEKVNLLCIPRYIVEEHGVVSEIVARMMCENARKILGVDVCVSFTGNAGPDAMEGKPVGEVYIGIAYKENSEVYPLHLEGSRNEIQQQAVEFALKKLTLLKK